MEHQPRITALTKYLLVLAKSYGTGKESPGDPSAKRKRLHILYIINDVLHATRKLSASISLDQSWGTTLPALVACTAVPDKYPKHSRNLELLLTLWKEKGYFSDPVYKNLKDSLSGKCSSAGANVQATSMLLAKDVPYNLPSMHGDIKTRWYDLPTTTWLSNITPNSSKAINYHLIRPTPLVAGPAGAALADSVKNMLGNAEQLFAKDAKWGADSSVDITQLGDKVLLDEITGEIIGGMSYYGWTRQFCTRMKDRGRNPVTQLEEAREDRSRSRGRRQSNQRSSYSRSRSRSRSYTPPASKRRRYSSSVSRSRSRNNSRSRRRKYSRSPQKSSHRSSSRSNQRNEQFSSDYQAPPPPPPPQGMPPAPPARPPNYLGQWPPPPPPPPLGGGFNNQQQQWVPDPAMMAQMMNNMPPGMQPPFPGPSPEFHGHAGRGQYQGYGQSHGGNNYNNRGGGNGYRGRGRGRANYGGGNYGGGYGRGRGYGGNY